MLCLRISFVFLFVLFVEKSVGQDLTLAGSQFKDLIGKDLKDLIKIPDQNFKKGKVYDIEVLSANYPNVKISLAGFVLTIEITNFNIKLAAKWKIQIRVLLLKLKASGTVEFTATGISIKLKVDIRTWKVISCADSIKRVDANFKGKDISGQILSFIAKSFKKLVNNRIKKRLDGEICKAAKSLINNNQKTIAGWLKILIPAKTTTTTRGPLRAPPRRRICLPGKPCPGEP